jgi:hypothetical protein
MDMTWQVEANNTKGDMIIEVVKSHNQAKIRHRELLAEKDNQGMLKWGYVRSFDLVAAQEQREAEQRINNWSKND